MSADRIVYWMGRPIEDLSREELVDALETAAHMLRVARSQADAEREIFSAMRTYANSRDAG